MTKVRPPLSPSGALWTIAGLIGWPSVCATIGLKDAAARNLSDPDTTQCVTIDRALKLDNAFVEAGGAYRPFLAAFAAVSEVEDARIGEEIAGLAQAAAAAAIETGQAHAAAFAAVAPGAPESALVVAEVEAAEACEAQSRLLQKIRSMLAMRRRI